jgi:hypothetical protein
MRLARSVAAAAILTAAAFTGLVTSATTASALSPCAGYEPPDWCFSPPAAPAAPTSLTATGVFQTSVSMTWTNNAGSRPYTVTRTANGASTSFNLPGGATSFTDSSAPAGSKISYTVFATACNTFGCTDGGTASLSVTTHPSPADPAGTAYGSGLPCYYNCSTDPNKALFQITGKAIDWDTTAPIQVVLVADGVVTGTPITASASSSSDSSSIGYGTNHGYQFGWLQKSQIKGRHQTCVKALNVGGGGDVILGCYAYSTLGKPAAASNLTATRYPSSVSVAFTDNADDETGYYLQRSTDGGASWLQVGSQYPPVAGVGGRGTVTDYSTVTAATCYRILMLNSYGATESPSACTS